MIAGIDDTLPDGWSRVSSSEDVSRLRRLTDRDQVWYLRSELEDQASIELGLDRREPGEIRGGGMLFHVPTTPRRPVIVATCWGESLRFFEYVVQPAAERAGLKVRQPSDVDQFFEGLPFDVRYRLEAFQTGASSKSLRLDEGATKLWEEFVISVFRTGASVDPALLIQWLEQAGWSTTTAVDLARRLSQEQRLLSRFTEEAFTR
jgi:hypothetical protein